MSAVVDLPVDVEALVVAYLAGKAPVTTLAGTRISTRYAADFPRSGTSVRVTLVGLRSSPLHGRLQTAQIQINGYGPGPNTGGAAYAVTAAVYKALLEMPDTTLDGVFVTAAVPIIGIVTNPDEPTATSGYRFAVMLHFHRIDG